MDLREVKASALTDMLPCGLGDGRNRKDLTMKEYIGKNRGREMKKLSQRNFLESQTTDNISRTWLYPKPHFMVYVFIY